MYWGVSGSQRHSSSSSLLKERSEVIERACRSELRISHATCTAAPVSLEIGQEKQYNKHNAHIVSSCSEKKSVKHLRCEWGHALAKLPLRFSKSLSLKMLSLKKASSWKNICDTLAIEDRSSGSSGGSCSRRVRVIPPRDSRSKQSGFVDSNWPVCVERPVIQRSEETENTVYIAWEVNVYSVRWWGITYLVACYIEAN